MRVLFLSVGIERILIQGPAYARVWWSYSQMSIDFIGFMVLVMAIVPFVMPSVLLRSRYVSLLLRLRGLCYCEFPDSHFQLPASSVSGTVAVHAR